jgi:uncharacterized protein (DUF433 family)
VSVANVNSEPWKARLTIPNYRVGEAARYARVSSQTVTNWQSIRGNKVLLSRREDRASLSYMQLIELAVVAAFRDSGVTLQRIFEAREFIKNQFESEYPFADYRFKTDGKVLLMDYSQVDPKRGKGKLLELNKHGQLAWEAVLDARLREFDYDKKARLVLRWHVAGPSSSIVIDPRLSFGAPTVRGTPTWAIKGRWIAGEQIDQIADDFGLKEESVFQALQFEGINVGSPKAWGN